MEPNIPSAPFEFKVRALCALRQYSEAIEMERHYWELQGQPTNQAAAKDQKLRQAFDTEGRKGYWRVQLEFAEASTLRNAVELPVELHKLAYDFWPTPIPSCVPGTQTSWERVEELTGLHVVAGHRVNVWRRSFSG